LVHLSDTSNQEKVTQQLSDCYFRDNGFSSLATLEKCHSHIVKLAKRHLSGLEGNILDLGCGNGLLLKRVCAGGGNLVPYGVDVNGESLEHARELNFGPANFRRANIFDSDIWTIGSRYVLSFLSLQRLLEVTRKQSDDLLAAIQKHCDKLIVYCYPQKSVSDIEDMASRLGLQVTDIEGGIAGLAVLKQVGQDLQHRATRPIRKEQIDWSRMAAPQPDGYDTQMVLRMRADVTKTRGAEANRPLTVSNACTLFNGKVIVVNRSSGGLIGAHFAPARCDHPHLIQAAKYLEAWPDVARQFPQLVHTIQPWNDTSRKPEEWLSSVGSSSHSLEEEFGIVMVTVDNPIGLATAFVHEMAHHKLRALGVSILSASRLITNRPEELYVSPIKGRKRPFTALLHAQYSFIHVVSLEGALQRGNYLSSDEKERVIPRFSWHVAAMERGYKLIQRHARVDYEGRIFLDSFMSWSSEVLKSAREILARR